jgi:hypothetical protein
MNSNLRLRNGYHDWHFLDSSQYIQAAAMMVPTLGHERFLPRPIQFIVLPIILSKEELRDLYSSPSIIRMAKSRRMRWAGHVSRMGVKRNAYRLLVG